MKVGDRVKVATGGFDPMDDQTGKIISATKNGRFLVQFEETKLEYHKDELELVKAERP